MRCRPARGRPPAVRRSVMPVAAALLAMVAIGTAGCSSAESAAVAPSVSATSRVPTTTLVEPTPVEPSQSPSPSQPQSASQSASPVPVPSSAAPRLVRAAPLARSVPVRLRIGAIGVDSTLMSLGLRQDRTMEVPPGGFPAGWYTGAPTPGELGPAIIAGHVDMKGPGVFFKLEKVRPGDLITVSRADGSNPVFRVVRVAKFAKDQFPTQLVYGDIDRPVLRVITCGGSFNSQTGHYEDNIVVFADLVTPAR